MVRMAVKKNHDPSLVLKRKQVGIEFHEKFIINGYRCPNSTFTACLKSVFYLNNNETINFWTHFIPFVLISYKFIRFSLNININTDDYQWPFFIYLFTSAFYLLMSSMAHALNCMSSIARHVCFILDYLSISMYGMGCCIGYKTYSLENMPSYTTPFFDYYVTYAMCLTIISNTMASASRFVISHRLRPLVRLIPFICQYMFISSPLIYRLLIKYIPSLCCYLNFFFNNGINYHFNEKLLDSDFYYLLQLICIIMSVLIYVTHVPERYAPGMAQNFLNKIIVWNFG
jgi:predicted membrane channel-forming protein YqfA (hemolysin III family)